jgi:hypothetical protein
MSTDIVTMSSMKIALQTALITALINSAPIYKCIAVAVVCLLIALFQWSGITYTPINAAKPGLQNRTKQRINKERRWGLWELTLDPNTQALVPRYSICRCADRHWTTGWYLAGINFSVSTGNQGGGGAVTTSFWICSLRSVVISFVVDEDTAQPNPAAEGDADPVKTDVLKATVSHTLPVWMCNWCRKWLQGCNEVEDFGRMRVPDAPLPSQAKLIDRVLETIQRGRLLTVFAAGAPGTGKSTLAELLASRLPAPTDAEHAKAVVVSFNPLDPYQNVQTLLAGIGSVYNNVVIEVPEADKLLLQTAKPDTKPMWNAFFDTLNRSMPDANIVVLISSNISLRDCVAAGACFSCVRRGRVHIECELGFDADTTLVRDACLLESDLMADAPHHAAKKSAADIPAAAAPASPRTKTKTKTNRRRSKDRANDNKRRDHADEDRPVF